MVFTAVDANYQNAILGYMEDLMNYSSDELDQLNAWLEDMIEAKIVTKCTSRYLRSQYNK